MTEPSLPEEALFAEALEIRTAEERAAFLDRHCGDNQSLRAEVEALLLAHQRSGDLLDLPEELAAAPTLTMPRPLLPGTLIGPYKLLQQIGEGGMGVVFLAKQQQPVQRQVALKIIKPGMDSRQVIARFEAERQALALMDHLNIARVLDGGATESGSPYFVMELINGIPITKYCDNHQLTLRERLELFVSVCHAVQHAHQKGIIHRDLKPSNVLVTHYDGKPVPKVIDFGVAKAINQKLTDDTLFTNFGMMLGTLQYMSPEQAEMSAQGIDTRSDIYSLGVLLYELLTGSTPLTRKRLKEAANLEILRLIKEEEPQKPSTRLSESEEALASISAMRKTEPAKLSKLMRGELDWIVMKTLEKDRNRRYETANGLAMEVQRYLADEPVQACPPSKWYRVKKFVRRNRSMVIAASLVLLALVGGIIGTMVGLVQANIARGEALEERDEKERARAAEEKAKGELHKRLKQVERANEVIFSIFDDLDPNVLKNQGKSLVSVLGVRLVDATKLLVSDATGDPLVVAKLQSRLGLCLLNLGRIQQASALFVDVLATHRLMLGPDHHDTLASMDDLAKCHSALNRHSEALNIRETTLALRKAKLGHDHPHTLKSMYDLAHNYVALNRPADVLKALELHEETFALRRAKLGPDHPDTLHSMNSIAISYAALGRRAEAHRLFEETLTRRKASLGPDHPETLASMHNLALSYAILHRNDDALKLHEDTLARRKAQLGPDHPETLRSMGNVANTLFTLGRRVEALKVRTEVLALRKVKLGPDHPETLGTYLGVADCLSKLDRGAEAVPFIDECVGHAVGKVVHPELIPALLDLRLRHFEKVKNAAECRATAEMWEKLKRMDAEGLYQSARYRAVTAAVLRTTDHSQVTVEADRAMAWLTQAVAMGYNDATRIKTDKDLDTLRERNDYRKLISELEAKRKQ